MQRTLRKFFPLFVLPTLIAFVIVFLIPFLMGIYLSFTEFTTVTDSQWVGLKNYITAFTANKEFVNALWFTVKFAVVSVVSINVIGFAMASLLTRGIRGTNLFRTVLFMPNLIGGIVLGWIWQMIFNGILYHYEMTLTFNASFGFWGLVILMNWQMIGYMMIIYIAGIQSIPTELYDAPSKKTTMLALDIYNTFYGRVGFEGVGQAKAVVFFVLVAGIAFVQLWLTRSKEVDQ